MRESKDIHKLKLHDLFADLKSYEFELQTRDGEPSVPQITNALSAIKLDSPVANEQTKEKLFGNLASLCAKIKANFNDPA